MTKSWDVLILGGSGMLGYSTARFINEKSPHLSLLITSRRNPILPFSAQNLTVRNFEYLDHDHSDLRFLLSRTKTVINCIGLTWQRAKNSTTFDEYAQTNFRLPLAIDSLQRELGFHYIHIGTDCVFQGDGSGKYEESYETDAMDSYGRSKRLADENLQNAMILRSSIIGKSPTMPFSLLDWFLRSERNSRIRGFTNHMWNGIGAIQFARILNGLLEDPDLMTKRTQHIVPSDCVSKYDLLTFFAKYFGRDDIVIEKFETEHSVDRTLSTEYADFNRILWSKAGYLKAPKIEEMIEEMSMVYQEWGIL